MAAGYNGKRNQRKKRPSHVAYIQAKRWLLNKVRRLRKVVRDFPNDLVAKGALERAEKSVRMGVRQ